MHLTSDEEILRAAEELSETNPEGALKLIDSVLLTDSAHVAAHLLKARICQSLGRIDDAQALFLTARRIAPNVRCEELETLLEDGSPALAPASRPRIIAPGEPSQLARGTSGFVAALLIALAVHAGAAVVLMSLFLAPAVLFPPPLRILAAPEEILLEVDTIAFERLIQPKPRSPSSSVAPVLSAYPLAPIEVPEVDTSTIIDPLELGVGLGLGFDGVFGISAGSLEGAGMNFFGNKAVAKKVVFVVDASKSMNADRQDVMRRELSRAVNALPADTLYQIFFFSGPAWAHDRFGTETGEMAQGIGEYEQNEFEKMYKKGKYEATKLRRATRSNIRESLEIIENLPMSSGTRWSPGIELALSCDPIPDVIYFMTDGKPLERQETPVAALSRIKKARRKAGNKTQIYATALMAPKAASQMEKLADICNGEFNVVMPGDGDTLITIRGEDWMEGKRDGRVIE